MRKLAGLAALMFLGACQFVTLDPGEEITAACNHYEEVGAAVEQTGMAQCGEDDLLVVRCDNGTLTHAGSTFGCDGESDEPIWHADADRDIDLGDQTLYMDKETPGLPSSRLSIVDDPLGLYGKVYRANLTAADINAGDNRAEWNEALLGDGETELNLWGENGPGSTDVFVGWRSMFGGDLALTGSDNDGNFLQWKGDSSCGGPAVGMTVRNNRLSIRTIDGDYLAYMGPLMTSLMDGRWHDMVLRVNFSKTSTGFVEFTLDGVPQTMVNGSTRIYLPTVCPNDSFVFPKWGVYGMDVGIGAGPVHWLSDPRIGLSYGAVAP